MKFIFAQQHTPQELRDQIRTSVQNEIRTAQAQNAAQTSGANAGRKVTISTPDGKTITVTNPDGGIPQTVGGDESVSIPTATFIRNLDVPPRAASVAMFFFLTMAVIIIGLPIARAFGRLIDRRSQQPQTPPQVTAQLTQLTQAVDAIAIEVERISEGQRFTTKLLSEQQKAAKGLPSSS
jgi:hypothetical protein